MQGPGEVTKPLTAWNKADAQIVIAIVDNLTPEYNTERH